jgi:hypothetical protein
MKTARRFQSTQGVALLVTLAAIVTITVLVVTYAVVVRLETSTARSSFDAERAQMFSTIAVDEVVTKLGDNIPTQAASATDKGCLWAAGPGRLYTYDPSQAGKPWRLTKLYSGVPAPGDPAWKSIALNGPSLAALLSHPILSPNAEHPTPNPMVVSWINLLQDGTRSTDPDFATKLNANNPIVGRYAYWVDTETSKVNLNTAGLAKTTYRVDSVTGAGDMQNLTAHPGRVDLSQLDGGGGVITAASSAATYAYTDSSFWSPTPASPSAAPSANAATVGKGTFGSIFDWGTRGGTSVTPAQIEANKFNLTTLARTPELNPWGLNKWWWQPFAPQVVSKPGNRLNAPGVPVYSNVALESRNTYLRLNEPDSRYYAYPAMIGKNNNTNLALSTTSQHAQWLGDNLAYAVPGRSNANFQNYMTTMMALLSRTDWPGFPARSFVDKYGIAECEDLAANLAYLYDSTIQAGGQAPNNLSTGGKTTYGEGTPKYTRPTGTPRLMMGVGPWMYLNEVGVKFEPTTDGWTPLSAYFTDYVINDASKLVFSPPVSDPAKYRNVKITPLVEVYSPPVSSGFAPDGIKRNYNKTESSTTACTSIEVIAEGLLDGAPVTYSGPNYRWGRSDEKTNNNSFPLFEGRHYNEIAGGNVYLKPDGTPTFRTFRSFYIGPFDIDTSPKITVKFRVVEYKRNRWTHLAATQIAPVGEDTGISVADDPANPTKFVFTVNANSLSPDLELSDTTVLPFFLSYDLADPRVYRYLSDWTLRSGNLQSGGSSGPSFGSANVTYQNAKGAGGDDSKVAWPDTSAYAGPLDLDARLFQFATNIVGFPGVGWLSILPVNSNSSRNPDGSAPAAAKAPTPWKTLNFGPATDANELPDWLLIDIFALAYNQTFLSQTQGKININAEIAPFEFSRLAPLKALLIPSNANPTTDATTIANDIANYSGINSGPCANLPSDMFVYAGQICQVASLQGSGANQFQKEALIRDIAGLVTTQCSDFKVYVISQSLVSTTDPDVAPKVLAEKRSAVTVSRVVDVGPDDIPGTSDDMAGPDRIPGTSDDLTFLSRTGAPVASLQYDSNDPVLEGGSGRPPFRFQVTKIEDLSP